MCTDVKIDFIHEKKKKKTIVTRIYAWYKNIQEH